jgi:cytochrome bd ubiquinol oxidase subunit II
LLAAFPLAYAVVLSALYLPLILMLIGLIFRGVAFEFRFKAREHERHFWDKAFICGSVVASFFQGVALGAYIQGFPVVDRAYAGGPLDWLTPFSVFTGAGLVVAFALLGSTWLIMKTEGSLQQRAYGITKWLAWILLLVIVAISVWTPLTDERIAQRWFSWPNMIWFAPVPLLVVAATAMLLRAIRQKRHAMPFLCTLALVFLGYSGLGISLWPNIIPPSITIWSASAPPQSQGFTLVGALLIIPFILMYTLWAYYVFRGKVRHGEGYH